MISHCSQIFSVEYTLSGSAIVTEDLLGLDARKSVIQSSRTSTLPMTNCSNQDLIGLEFSMQPSARHSSLTRPKPAARQSVNRAGIVDHVQLRRDAVLLQENPEQNSQPMNESGPASLDEENLTDIEQPVFEDTKSETAEEPVVDGGRPAVVERPVPTRRISRSSSFDSHLSPTHTTAPAPLPPVPPPKRNRQRAAMNMSMLQSQIEELSARLRSMTEERDAALARVTQLESVLCRYHEKYGHID